MYLATFLVKEERDKTECNVAVTYASSHWAKVMFGHINTSSMLCVVIGFVCLYVFCIDIEAEVQTWVEFVKDCSIPIQV